MGDSSTYGGVQQPVGPYGNAGGSSQTYGSGQVPSSSYMELMQKGPTTTQSPPTPAASQPSPQEQADAMVETMAEIYKKLYSVKKGRLNVTLGPKVGKKIPVKLVEDADMTAAVTDQAQRVGNDIIKSMLKFNPESVLQQLTKYYATLGDPLPDRLNSINENTVLTAGEQSALFGFIKAALVADVRKDVDQTLGFFMLPQSATDAGTIVVRAQFAQSQSSPSALAGTIAHELAHAYAEDGWRDFMRVMMALNMARTGKLEEGMATFIEDQVVGEWIKSQPAKTPRPPLGYSDDAEVANSANTFIRAVTKKYALLAFFGGWIEFDNPDKPQDTIRIGEKREKKWRWPWH